MASTTVPSESRTPPLWIPALAAFMAVVFAANGILIWLSSHGHRDLVREDYYDAGLHQDKVIALTSAAGSVALAREGDEWVLKAESGPVAAAACKIRFYRPDDGRADREIALRRAPGPDGKETWRGSAPALRRGHWIAIAIWERDGAPVREASLELSTP